MNDFSGYKMRPPFPSHVKDFLEQWYQNMGRPKIISQTEKDEILRKITVDLIYPTGITLSQLNNWLRRKRKDETVPKPMSSKTRIKGQSISQRNPTRLSILFPDFTRPELKYLQILVADTPDPSLEIIEMWSESPSLPNVTVGDAQRFVKYNLARLRQQHGSISTSPSSSKHPLPRGSAEMEDSFSEEEDMLEEDRVFFDHTHLPTPTSTTTSPEPHLPFIKPEPSEDDANSSTSNPSTFSPLATHTTHHQLSQPLTSSPHPTPIQGSLGNVFEKLVDVFNEKHEPITPHRFMELFETCQEKSDKFMTALKKGELVKFGFPPREELGAHIGMAKPTPEVEGTTRLPEPP